MCRFAAYIGPPAPLSTLLYDPPHSLEVQAYAPRQMRSGTVNVDGTGVAWWPEPGPPLRYVTAHPPWSDPNLPRLAARLRGGIQVAAVRSATPGAALGTGAVAPFVFDGLAGAHNGFLSDFGDGWVRPLLERLPDDLHAGIEAHADSPVIMATVAHRLRDDPDGGLAGAVGAAIADIGAQCAAHHATATLNLLVSDGHVVVASRAAIGTPSNSLYVLADGACRPGTTILASEPLDADPGWTEVDDGSVITVAAPGIVTDVAVPTH